MRQGQADRRSPHFFTRGHFPSPHILLVRRAGNFVCHTACLFGVGGTMFPNTAHEPTRIPRQPVAITCIRQYPRAVHDRILVNWRASRGKADVCETTNVGFTRRAYASTLAQSLLLVQIETGISTDEGKHIADLFEANAEQEVGIAAKTL